MNILKNKIPENWKIKNIGEVIKLEYGFGLPKNKRKAGLYPVFGSNGIIGFHNKNFISAPGIIIGRKGSIGKVSYTNLDFCPIDTTYYVKNKENNNWKWLFLILSISDLENLNSATGIPGLNRNDVYNLEIPVPPIEDQEKIASTLADIDGLISSLNKLIKKKKNIRQGTLQELLRPRGEWKEKVLGETAVLKARIGWQGLTTAEYKENGDFILITGTDFKNGFIDWSNCCYVDKCRYDQDKNIQIKVEDVLVTKDGTIGKVAFVHSLPKPATLNSGVFVIRPIQKLFHPHFFYYILSSKAFDEFLAKLSAGSTITHLYQKDFINFKFLIPPTLEEQIYISNVLSSMDNEIQALEEKLGKYKDIEQGMIKGLLNGRIRLVGVA